MSDKHFTPDQQKAIDLHDRNILVSAAAGSGKTAVLVERIINMVAPEQKTDAAGSVKDTEKGIDIDRLLVVTFTNAAAAEMRERISAAISDRLQKDPANERLQRQATLIHNAQITTIDSFCAYILRNHFEAIGLDPSFRICEEGEKKLLMESAMEELFEKKYAAEDPGFLRLIECYGDGAGRGLAAQVSKVAGYALSYSWPLEWLEMHKKDYAISSEEELEKCLWMQKLEIYVRSILLDVAGLYKRALAITEEPDGPYYYGDNLEAELEMVERAVQTVTFGELSGKISQITFDRLKSGSKKDAVDPEKKDLVKKMRDQAKETITKLRDSFFALPFKQQIERMQQVSPVAEAFLGLCQEYLMAFDAVKREKNVIDFSDMEHMALQILLTKDENGNHVPSDVAIALREHYEEILIDEYQDSNQVQEDLLGSISREAIGRPNRFMVGDVKQSIYRFRMARPQIFMEKYEHYALEDNPYQKIILAKNFRSRQEVLDRVNAIFYQIMGKDLGDVEYDDEVALYPGASFPEEKDHAVEALLVDLSDEAEAITDHKITTDDHVRMEARAVALRIRKMIEVKERVQDKDGSLREVSYKDMVILMRAPGSAGEIYQKELAEFGIPVYISGNTGYFEATEVQMLLQLLRCVDNPRDDIPLFGTMRSFFGGFTDGELAQIRADHPETESLYEALLVGNDPKVLAFLEMLHTLQEKETYLSIEELLQEILQESGYLNYVTALPAGEQRSANVLMLLQKAADFEQTSFHGLNQFIRYMDQLKKYEVDYGEAETLDESADVVRIMSIHKSKGLEFPVCFVSALGKGFNKRDSSDAILTDMDLGIGMDLLLTETKEKKSTLRKEALSTQLSIDSMGEELRVLYVAMTRAKEKLILTGYQKDLEKSLTPELPMDPTDPRARERISYLDRLSAKSFLELLLKTHMRAIMDVTCVTCKELAAAVAGEGILKTGTRLELEDFLSSLQGAPLQIPEDKIPEAEFDKLRLLKERFAFTYPHKELENLFIKTSVSELKLSAMPAALAEDGEQIGHQLYEEVTPAPYIPHFMRTEEELGGAGAGTAVHRFMELLHFEKPLEGQGEEFLHNGRITEKQLQAVPMKKVEHFLASSLGQRMCLAQEAGTLKKEQPFVISLPASVINASPGFVAEHGLLPEGERILVQGVIDACFPEGDHWILMDYKTDRVKTAQELSDKYRVQLEFYKRALEQLTAKPVTEMWIYSFALEQEIRL